MLSLTERLQLREKGCVMAHNTGDVADEIIDYTVDVIRDLPVREQVMVLCYVAEHFKAHAETILAHDYHQVLYKRKGGDE